MRYAIAGIGVLYVMFGLTFLLQFLLGCGLMLGAFAGSLVLLGGIDRVLRGRRM